jgi:hypothetical protein
MNVNDEFGKLQEADGPILWYYHNIFLEGPRKTKKFQSLD